jgi:hypothetical protein
LSRSDIRFFGGGSWQMTSHLECAACPPYQPYHLATDLPLPFTKPTFEGIGMAFGGSGTPLFRRFHPIEQ